LPLHTNQGLSQRGNTDAKTGDKVYLEFTYRRPRFLASTLVAVHAVVLGFTASNCIVFGEYTLFAAGKNPGDQRGEVRLLAVGLMIAITIIHGCFLRTGILIQNILGWIKLALVAFMVLASVFVVATGHRPSAAPSAVPSPSPFTSLPSWSSLWEGSVWNWGIISTALFKVFYSYSGLQNANNVVNEIVNPVRTLKTAATTALIASCILYLLVNVAYFLVVPLEEIKDSGELIAALFFERLFGRSEGGWFLSLAVAVSAAGNVMVVTFALVRSSSCHDILLCVVLTEKGPSQPRDRPPGVPPLRRAPLLHETLRCTTWRANRTLHPVNHCHLHPREKHLLFHP